MNLEKEILKLRIALEKETNKDIIKILLEQKKQLEQMRKNVGSLYMKYGNDDGILDLSFADRHNEMKKVEKDIVDTRDTIAKATIVIAGATLLKSYVDSYYKTAGIIDKGISININYKLLRPEFVDAVVNADFKGQNFSSRIWKNTDKLANKLYDTIGRGITDGTKIQKLSKEIKDAFGVSSFEAKRLVNTEMARVVTNAQDEIYKDSGVVDKVMWIATLDDVTAPDHAELDGNIYDLNDPSRPQPPLRPNCRCTIIPYIEGWSPKTRRDNITKENIPYTNYTDWAKENNINN